MRSRPVETSPRHRLPDRVFRWAMALSVIALCATAFLPIVGIRFDWVPIHWIAGLFLVALVLFHPARVAFVHGLREMTLSSKDLREIVADIVGRTPAFKPAKYDAYQKGYHWLSALILLALIVTSLLMLLKIDTPFWRRDPSILTDPQWGVIYVIHGLSSLALLFLVIVHIYFAILPEHRAVLASMIAGRGPLFARGAPHDRQH